MYKARLACFCPGLKHMGKGAALPVETAGADYINPCIDYDLDNYLARADVLEALHVEPNTTWFGCSDDLFFNWSECVALSASLSNN
jgi:hypothetical protein